MRHNNAHPPLYYLLLKASLWLSGASPLAYRTVSIAATLVSTLLLAGIVRRITGNQPLAVVGAAAFGLSLSATDIGLEARAYALGIAFLLVAFSAYLDWLGTPVAFVPSWKRAVFAGALTAALVTHYASFFLAAALSVPLVLACGHRRWRVRLAREIQRRPAQLVFMFGIPAAAAALEYAVHGRSAVHLNSHVADFLHDHGRESVLAFVARTTHRLAVLFSPDLGERLEVYTALSGQLIGSKQRPVLLVDWSDMDECKRHFLLRASVPMEGQALTMYDEAHTLRTKEEAQDQVLTMRCPQMR